MGHRRRGIAAAGGTVGGTPDTIAFVQEVGKHNTTGSISSIPVSVGVNTTAGNTVILRSTTNQRITGVADSRSNTWTVHHDYQNGPWISVASAHLTTAIQSGDTITVTMAGATSYHGVVIDEWANIDAYGAASTDIATTNTTRTCGSSVSASAGALVLGIWGIGSGASESGFAASGAYTAFHTAVYVGAGSVVTEGVYQVDSGSGGAYTPAATGANQAYRGFGVYFSATG